MKAIEFNHNTCAWDAYRRPYHGVGRWRSYFAFDDAPFIVFDTGEVIAKYTSWNKDRRHRYGDLEVTVFSTTDADAPTLYYDTGEAVPKAHLTVGGGQDLMLDEATGIVVGCGYGLPDGNYSGRHRVEINGRDKDMPSYFWFKQLSVYWPGPGRAPVGSRIKVVRPIKRDADQRKHTRDLQAAAAAWRAMQDEDASMKFWSKQKYSPQNKKVVHHSTLLKIASFADMPEDLRWKVGAWALVSDLETVYLDRLMVKQ